VLGRRRLFVTFTAMLGGRRFLFFRSELFGSM
jgi:hypothetical protein